MRARFIRLRHIFNDWSVFLSEYHLQLKQFKTCVATSWIVRWRHWKNLQIFAALITQFLPDFCKTHLFCAKFLHDSYISCKSLASIVYFLQDSCNINKFLSRFLQDWCVFCKILARYLQQEQCIILQNFARYLARTLQGIYFFSTRAAMEKNTKRKVWKTRGKTVKLVPVFFEDIFQNHKAVIVDSSQRYGDKKKSYDVTGWKDFKPELLWTLPTNRSTRKFITPRSNFQNISNL